MPDRNTVPFNSMTAGYAQHGLGTEALLLFEEMLESDNPPTSITFISVLSACAHTERIDEGFGYFNSVRDKYGVEPEEEHHFYRCLEEMTEKMKTAVYVPDLKWELAR